MDDQGKAPTGSDLTWLVQPRWAGAAAYLIALLLAAGGAIPHMDTAPVLVAAGLTVATNLWARSLGSVERVSAPTLGLLLFDLITLTVVLYLTGGASNPLSSLYLLPIALAAVMLDGRSAWAITVLAVAAFGALFLAPHDHSAHAGHDDASAEHGGASPEAHADHSQHAHHGPHAEHAAATATAGPQVAAEDGQFGLHLRGMWIAFTLTALMVTYFLTRITGAMRKQEGQLVLARTRALRAERVASLASLAASTAHELGTPIASISLAASEMQAAIKRGVEPGRLAEDAQLVHEQAHRCREILDHMLTEAGETVGEAPSKVGARSLVEDAVGALPPSDQARVEVDLQEQLPELHLPRKIVTQALHNLLRNALDASPHDKHVKIRVEESATHVRFRVEDEGVGMGAEALAEAMEPFVSTKPGRGKGLGLFLTRAVAERLGGQLRISSSPGQGTQAIFELASNGVGSHQSTDT